MLLPGFNEQKQRTKIKSKAIKPKCQYCEAYRTEPWVNFCSPIEKAYILFENFRVVLLECDPALPNHRIIILKYKHLFVSVDCKPEQVHISYGDTLTEMVIMWSTPTNCSSVVQYGTDPWKLSIEVSGRNEFFSDIREYGIPYLHRVVLQVSDWDKKKYFCMNQIIIHKHVKLWLHKKVLWHPEI